MATFYKLSIKSIVRETAKCVTIEFTVPQELKTFYGFVAGQYVTLKLTLDGQEIRRAYSLCSSPESNTLRVAVKEVPGGLFSTFANKQLKEGQLLEVSLPEGKFTFEPKTDRQKNYAGIAAGSGITPVYSIIQSVLTVEPKSTFVLLYGNKTPEDTIFKNALEQLEEQFIGRFFVQYAFSKADAPEALFGRIDQAAINFTFYNKHKAKEFETFYLCGPEEMINLSTTVLKSHNILDKNIKFELFTASSSEQKISSNSNHSKVTLIVDDETSEFEMISKQTLLEAALKQGLDVPYSCQGGICSSCIARVTEGTAEMKKNSILTDGEIEDGLILTCQACPTSDSITINFDEV